MTTDTQTVSKLGAGVGKRWALVLIAAYLSLSAGVMADDDFSPIFNPTLEVSRTSSSIGIDGDLTDPGWQGVNRATNFVEHSPGIEVKPPVETEAFITYDQDNLYVGIVCHDDPSVIRATYCERDQVYSDDNVGFFIETYGDAAWAYTLNVNPFGIQADALWSAGYGEDSGYDLIWESAGKITDSGYQVELAIPFASLRFPNKPIQTWRVEFYRHHQRESHHQISWTARDLDESCWPCQWGTLIGIENVQPGKGIEILPSFVGFQSGALADMSDPHAEFHNADPDGEVSLSGKYAVTSDIMVEATANPDFSQVEADPAQIDVNTTFALFFAERRPFFQEGSDLFRTFFDAVYTRSINDPLAAAKLTGRMGRTSIAYLFARDENSPIIMPFEESSEYLLADKSVSNFFRARQTFGEASQVGLLLTDRRLDDGGSGTLYSAEGTFKLSRTTEFVWQAVGTHTREPDDTDLTAQISSRNADTTFDSGEYTTSLDGESFSGHALYGEVERSGKHLYLSASYLERSPTFRADNGFETRNDQRSARWYTQYTFFPASGLIERISPMFALGSEWNFEGQKKKQFLDLDLSINLKIAQTSSHLAYRGSSENYGGVQFDNLWLYHICTHHTFSNFISARGNINISRQIARRYLVKGDEVTFAIGVDLKPTNRLLLESTVNFAASDDAQTGADLYEGHIVWNRLSYQFNRELSLRLVLQYDDFEKSWDIDPLLTWRLNPFSKFYIGSTSDYACLTDEHIGSRHWKLCDRQFFMKLQYLFQI
jgi:hypothetical protein